MQSLDVGNVACSGVFGRFGSDGNDFSIVLRWRQGLWQLFVQRGKQGLAELFLHLLIYQADFNHVLKRDLSNSTLLEDLQSLKIFFGLIFGTLNHALSFLYHQQHASLGDLAVKGDRNLCSSARLQKCSHAAVVERIGCLCRIRWCRIGLAENDGGSTGC